MANVDVTQLAGHHEGAQLVCRDVEPIACRRDIVQAIGRPRLALAAQVIRRWPILTIGKFKRKSCFAHRGLSVGDKSITKWS
jgi:hypothetical protein